MLSERAAQEGEAILRFPRGLPLAVAAVVIGYAGERITLKPWEEATWAAGG